MLLKKRNEVIHKFIEERCFVLMNTKGKEYSRDADANANFKRLARQLGLNKYQIWGVYAGKHWDSILSWIKEGKTLSNETIESRIADIVNYLLILASMIYEDRADQLDELKEKIEAKQTYEKPAISELDIPQQVRNSEGKKISFKAIETKDGSSEEPLVWVEKDGENRREANKKELNNLVHQLLDIIKDGKKEDLCSNCKKFTAGVITIEDKEKGELK